MRMSFRAAALAGAFVAAAIAAAPAVAQAPASPSQQAVATFAGGCFWCMEPPYDKLAGVISTVSGYMGGTKRNPTYEEVSTGRTGHTEVVQVAYDPSQVSYEKLLEVYWRNVDPTVKDRQFCDEQKRLAEASKAAIERTKPFKDPIVVPITQAGEFWKAEEYHQDYYKKNPVRYTYYRTGCGRDARLKEIWGRAGE